jgi:hypothetical protein
MPLGTHVALCATMENGSPACLLATIPLKGSAAVKLPDGRK